MFKMISLLLLLTAPAFADVSVPRAKQYAWTKYDVAVIGGESVPHASGLSLPAGAIITNVWFYINTQFAATGTESLGISCVGSQDIMAYTPLKTTSQDRLLSGNVSGSSFTGAAAPIPATPTVLNFSQGYGSVPNACNVTFDVRGASGYTPYTAGAGTAIIEYFKLQ
jgi:hypothetical protein